MKIIQWLVPTLLVAIGLVFLTVSVTMFIKPASFFDYVHNFFSICLWLLLPMIGFILFLIVAKLYK